MKLHERKGADTFKVKQILNDISSNTAALLDYEEQKSQNIIIAEFFLNSLCFMDNGERKRRIQKIQYKTKMDYYLDEDRHNYRNWRILETEKNMKKKKLE